jgi:Shedu protein SduA, C-terminal/Shedu protein SduA, N-terminal
MNDVIHVTPTSRHSAVANPIVIRKTAISRLIFLPEIHDNPAEPKACVSGTVVFQRKGKKDEWHHEKAFTLSSLKKGEGAKWHLSSSELLHFLRETYGVYKVYRRGNIFRSETEYMEVTDPLRELIKLGDAGLSSQLKANPFEAGKLVEAVIGWISASGKDKAFLDSLADLKQFRSEELNIIVRLASLRRLIRLWQANKENADEEFWQKELGKCPYAFSLIFPYAVVVVGKKAYVGGKDISNTGGNIADFLIKRELTGNCVVVEIKTPKTVLLGRQYRNTYSISQDISGATVQVQNYIHGLVGEETKLLSRFPNTYATRPKGIVLAGHTGELNVPQKRHSFELYRNSLEGVQLLTYDEFFHKAQMLVDLLRQR